MRIAAFPDAQYNLRVFRLCFLLFVCLFICLVLVGLFVSFYQYLT